MSSNRKGFIEKLGRFFYDAWSGGILLGKPPDSMSAPDILEAVEGAVELNGCVNNPSESSKASCTVRQLWSEAQEKVTDVLRHRSIAELAIGKAGKEV